MPQVYTFNSIVGDSIPKSVKCIHSATKNPVQSPDPLHSPAKALLSATLEALESLRKVQAPLDLVL